MKTRILSVLFSCLLFTNCTKDKKYVYEVNDVTVTNQSATKKNLKSTNEFISIAYSDLFASQISSVELNKLTTAYSSFGDKQLIQDMIIRNYLNNPSVVIPKRSQVLLNPDKFIGDTYSKFFNRQPSPMELYYIKNELTNDTTITPELIYYSMMTSDEYRYY